MRRSRPVQVVVLAVVPDSCSLCQRFPLPSGCLGRRRRRRPRPLPRFSGRARPRAAPRFAIPPVGGGGGVESLGSLGTRSCLVEVDSRRTRRPGSRQASAAQPYRFPGSMVAAESSGASSSVATGARSDRGPSSRPSRRQHCGAACARAGSGSIVGLPLSAPRPEQARVARIAGPPLPRARPPAPKRRELRVGPRRISASTGSNRAFQGRSWIGKILSCRPSSSPNGRDAAQDTRFSAVPAGCREDCPEIRGAERDGGCQMRPVSSSGRRKPSGSKGLPAARRERACRLYSDHL